MVPGQPLVGPTGKPSKYAEIKKYSRALELANMA